MTRVLPLLVALLALVAGLALTWLGQWRIGSVVIGLGMVAGAVERAVLSPERAGLLRVRSRAFDVALMAFGGVAVIGFAIAVPAWE